MGLFCRVSRKYAAYVLLTVIALAGNCFAAEVCTYNGTSSYSGRMQATTLVTDSGPNKVVRVVLKAHASFFFMPVDYIMDEISTWHDGELVEVGRSERYFFRNNPVRQIWDVFYKKQHKFMGYRVEGKKLKDIQRQYPGWVSYWPMSSYGRYWLNDFNSAPPQRRADLDLPANLTTPNIRTPLALAFYLVRFLPKTAHSIPLFIPGEKRYKRINVNLAAPTTTSSGYTRWLVPLNVGPLKTAAGHPAVFLISRDQRLVHVNLTMDWGLFSADGQLSLQNCRMQ